MRRVWVDSSSIASIGYESAPRELEIEFRESGDVYRYFDVPREEYAAFLAADSKGAYLNQIFKERNYRYRLVRGGT
jgi:KTSC domain